MRLFQMRLLETEQVIIIILSENGNKKSLYNYVVV